MDAEARERLVAEFRACLEALDNDGGHDGNEESAASLSAPDAPVDLSLLFAELSVLRNEVRIEARQFKTALDDMRGLTELLRDQNQRLTRDLERARETASSAQRQSERRLLLDLLDVRDRLDAAVTTFKAYQPSFLARFAAAEHRLAMGLGEGIELTLRRLDELLSDRRVRPIDAIGAALDPNTMRAVSLATLPAHFSGEVLREVRRGFMREDELLRAAEVIVNKLENQT